MNRSTAVTRYIKAVSAANNESAKKEHFINLLNEIFGDKDDFGVIPKFAAGAENSITNIQRAGKKSDRGAADTQYGTVIIEFENDLKRTGEHAREQLADYLVGNWNSGVKSRFTLIATDCLTWIVYAPDYDSLFGLGDLRADEIRLEKIAELKVSPGRSDEFYFFLDLYLFGTEPAPATLEEIRKRFGYGSDIFQAAIYHLRRAWETVKDEPAMLVARANWERFLRVAYGRFEAADYIFLIHSYLSVLAKMIAYAVVSGEDFFDDQTIKGIVSGEVFLKKNIANFTDNDFYRWIDGSSPELKKAFRVISSGLGELDFSNVKEDILKGVYQELVDDDTRHALGECYTPDWLCARIIDALKPRPGQKILDPACGSGSFLKAAANFMISQKPDISASELNECLYGIDIHPLSAQITKATLLIAYSKRLAKEKEPLRLNVYLANSLALPSSEAGLLGQNFRVVIDNRKIRIPADIFTDYKSLTRMIDSAETLAEAAFQTNSRKKDDALKKIFANRGFPEARLSRAALDLHNALLAAKQEKRDGIWAFILANTYAPIAMKGQFDLVVGNPPWLTYSDIKTSEYQKEIKYLAENTGVAPKKGSLITHIELAALFVAQSASYFLKPDGKLAFVMPRSVFVADHHDALRKGRIKAFAVDTLWDLKNVKPLFKIPSCVLFGHRSADRVRLKIEIPGLALSGKLPAVNCDIGEARELLTTDPRVYLLASMNERSAWTEEATRIPKPSPYKDLFNQGATLVPRCLCFIDIDQDMEGELEDRIVKVKSARASNRNPDPRWKDISISGNVHSKFIFKTILANNMAPFAVTGSYLVALPITTENGVVEILSPDNIELAGYIESAIFFRKAFSEWDANKTENNAVYSLSGYFNYLGKLSKQKFTKKFSVIYNRSGKDAAASVISGFSNRSVYDNSAYYFTTDNENEAFYICAVLNSSITNGLMKPFQSKGNFGPRDIHKKILDVPIPEFDPADDRHLELARLAKVAAHKAEAYIRQQNFDAQGNNMTPKQIGDFRKEVRGIVKSELDMIDRLTEEILGPFL